jgi:hypothetical protein
MEEKMTNTGKTKAVALMLIAAGQLSAASVTAQTASQAVSGPRQRVVISDDFTSWLLKGEGSERYGEGEALPRLLAEGWTIQSVTAGCDAKGRTIYVVKAPETKASR